MGFLDIFRLSGGSKIGKELSDLFNEKPQNTYLTSNPVLTLWTETDKKVKEKLLKFAEERKKTQTEATLERIGENYARDFLYYSYIYLATGRWKQSKKCLELAANDANQKGGDIILEQNKNRRWILKYTEIADQFEKKEIATLSVTQALIWVIPELEKLDIVKKTGNALWYEQDKLAPFGPNAPLHKTTLKQQCKEIGPEIMGTINTKLLLEEKTLKLIATYLMDDPIDAHDALTNVKIKVMEEVKQKTDKLLIAYLKDIESDFSTILKWNEEKARQHIAVFLQGSYALLAAGVTREAVGDDVPNFERCLEQLAKHTQITHGKGDKNWWLRYKPLGLTVKNTRGESIVPCGWALMFMYDLSSSTLGETYYDLRTLVIKLGYRQEIRPGVTVPKQGLKVENPVLTTTEDSTFSQCKYNEWILEIEKTAKKMLEIQAEDPKLTEESRKEIEKNINKYAKLMAEYILDYPLFASDEASKIFDSLVLGVDPFRGGKVRPK
ncbi:MAG: hypothetical protein WC556_07185 [Candidatus Methanoperedens sp.]